MVESVWSDEAVTVFVDESRFRSLPEDVRALVDGTADFVPAGGGSALCIRDVEAARRFLEATTRIERNRSRRESRISAENTLSGGRHEPSDLAAIFEIQHGSCYFTGEAIEWQPRTWSLDHLKPVCEGGSFWPANLALVLPAVNQHKHHRTKQQYWNLLERTRGTDWVAARKEVCREIDKARGKIDRERRRAVRADVAALQDTLRERFPSRCLNLVLESDDELVLTVDDAQLVLPRGFVRTRAFKRVDYYAGVVAAIGSG